MLDFFIIYLSSFFLFYFIYIFIIIIIIVYVSSLTKYPLTDFYYSNIKREPRGQLLRFARSEDCTAFDMKHGKTSAKQVLNKTRILGFELTAPQNTK